MTIVFRTDVPNFQPTDAQFLRDIWQRIELYVKTHPARAEAEFDTYEYYLELMRQQYFKGVDA